jgi:hypothetical protein
VRYIDPDGREVTISRGPSGAARVWHAFDNAVTRFVARNFIGMEADQWVKTMSGAHIQVSEDGVFSNREKDTDRLFFLLTTAVAVLKLAKATTLLSAVPASGTGTSKAWQVGDDIYAPTAKGTKPAWSTVRGRYWKNAAAADDAVRTWGADNVARMRKGLAPQRFNAAKGGWESMELSHEPIPFRDGGQNVVPRWPQDHALVDPYRYPGY